MKTGIMIPARAGSKRVPNKNLRLLSGKPLITYVIETCLETGLDVWVSTDDLKIMRMCQDLFPNVNLASRPAELASDTATNDDFMNFFMNTHSKYSHILQVLPTSPFVTVEEINRFLEAMVENDTVVSVKNAQIGCVYDNEPINFSKTMKNPPSQEMTPIGVYATSLMGWKRETFLNHMKELGCAYHGGNGSVSYFPLSGFSTIDIDNEEDFLLAEAVAQFIPFQDRYKKFYYEDGQYTDYIVPRVLKDDGIDKTTELKPNQRVVSVTDVMDSMTDQEAWYKTLIDSDSNSCTVVNQMPGEGNRRHYHAKWNEWWYILRGQWRFDVEDESYIVKPGDLVFIEKGNKHKITAIGDSIASRLAVSRYDVEHIYASKPDRSKQ
jgi:CMP-N,N'-diacetyllegionaminic acid synthase